MHARSGPSDDTPGGAASPPPEPTAAVLAQLDRLDAACRAAPGEIAPQVALWRAVTALDHWFFVNRGTPESPRPYALAAPQGAMLCAFSTAERARDAAHGAGLVAKGEPVPMFGMPLPGALDWATSLAAAGVVGVTIDHPRIGAWSPLQNLERLREERAAREA